MNRLTITLRTFLRRLGLASPMAVAMKRLGLFGGGQNFEEKFSNEMLASVEPGDVVWEIGANQGTYTRQFRERVGPEGRVFAFEPAPACFEVLTQSCESGVGAHCECYQVALGNESGTVRMHIEENPLGTMHSILTDEQSAASSETIGVEMVRGDELVAERGLPVPTFLKVDVEGSELDVFEGMCDILGDSRCRVVFCEVHFALLAERGQAYASKDIEALFKRCGLTQQRWIDPSHIVASRPKAT